ncbi:MAG: hypothetical protein QXM12_00640 [Nitrososphaerota archaeon]
MCGQSLTRKRRFNHIPNKKTIALIREVVECSDINECINILVSNLINLRMELTNLREDYKKLVSNRLVRLLIRLGLVDV